MSQKTFPTYGIAIWKWPNFKCVTIIMIDAFVKVMSPILFTFRQCFMELSFYCVADVFNPDDFWRLSIRENKR